MYLPADPSAAQPGSESGTGTSLVDLERERLAAQTLRRDAESLRTRVAALSPELWAAEGWRRAGDLLDEADRRLAEGHGASAAEPLRSAVELLEEIEGGAAAAFESAVADASARMDAGDESGASRALTVAGAIDPGAEELAPLRERLARLPAAREAYRRGLAAEREQRWSEAVEQLRQAVELDPQLDGAAAALARVEARREEEAFRSHLAAASAALDEGELATARDELAGARALRPEAAELGPLSDRLARLVQFRKAVLLASQAQLLEEEERWSEAAAKHAEALALAPRLESALEGEARCRRWADMTDRLERHLSDPDRLSSTEVLEEARALLEEALAMKPAGPRHQARCARLSLLIEEAATPVRVTLESDTRTEVVVHHVGRLGTFREQELELRPGRYTVTGHRTGYRDVRRELVVRRGDSAPRLLITCTEPI